jgi:CO/xanthine dehydrogenase Mo-binding subunit
VFASDAYRAEDAADAVTVSLDELTPVMSADGDPVEIDGLSSEPMVIEKSYGDLDGAFRAAHAVVEIDVAIGRHSAIPLETRGAIARHLPDSDMLELHGGVRGELYPEDVLVCLAALRLKRPVKWIEDRHEHFVSANHSRQQRHRLRAAVDKEGRILGLDDDFFHDQGAYVRTHGARVVDLTAGMLPGPYRVPNYRAAGPYRLTYKTPAATYRSPGRYESTFARERLMDAIAHQLGLDRIAVRRVNLVDKAEMPFERPITALGDEVVLDSGDYALLLDKTLTRLDWKTLNDTLAARRRNGELVGAGIAAFVEKSGLGPTDGVNISVEPSGIVEVVTGGASLGQGFETAMAQICAGALGVDYRSIRVVHGQTSRIDHGIGAHATRATVMTGSATHVAALKLRELALAAASPLLQTPAEELTIADGRVTRKSAPLGPSITLGELAARQPLATEGWFRTEHMAYPYGVHVAIVAIDKDTGALGIERYLIAYDIGRAVNPMLVDGQLVGGFAQGLGGAVSEEFVYDENGAPVSTTFADYLILTAHEVPPVDVLLTEDAPSPLNPLGLKGAGEGGVNAVGAAIASAVDDALGRPGAITQLPVTPARLRALIAQR